MGEQVNTIKHFFKSFKVVILKRDEIYDYLGSFPSIHTTKMRLISLFWPDFGYVKQGLMTG